MPFMKIIKKEKGVAKPVGTIVLTEEEESRDGYTMDTEGNEYPSHCLAPLTKEEAAECLKVEEIPI